jgi:hypothetical protein
VPATSKPVPIANATTFEIVPNPDRDSFLAGDVIAIEGKVWHRICRAGDVFTDPLEKTSGPATDLESTDVHNVRATAEANVVGIVQASGSILKNINVQLDMKNVSIERATVGATTIYPTATCRQSIANYRKQNTRVALVDAILRATSCTTFTSNQGQSLSAGASQTLAQKFGASAANSAASNNAMTACGEQLVWAVSLDTPVFVPAVKLLGPKDPIGDGELVECDVGPDGDNMEGWQRVPKKSRRTSQPWSNSECGTTGNGWAVSYGTCGKGSGNGFKECRRVRVIPHGASEWSKDSY